MDFIRTSLPFTNQEIFYLINEVKPLLEKDHSLNLTSLWLSKLIIHSRLKNNSILDFYFLKHGKVDIYAFSKGQNSVRLMRYFESFGNPSDDNQMGKYKCNEIYISGRFL